MGLVEACPVEVLDAKASELFEVSHLHACSQEVVESDSEPDVNCFDDLESSRALQNYWLLNDFPEVLGELEGIASCQQSDLQHLAGLSLVVSNPNVLEKGDLQKLFEFVALAIVLPLDGTLKYKQAFEEAKHALKALLVVKQLYFRR